MSPAGEWSLGAPSPPVLLEWPVGHYKNKLEVASPTVETWESTHNNSDFWPLLKTWTFWKTRACSFALPVQLGQVCSP